MVSIRDINTTLIRSQQYGCLNKTSVITISVFMSMKIEEICQGPTLRKKLERAIGK